MELLWILAQYGPFTVALVLVAGFLKWFLYARRVLAPVQSQAATLSNQPALLALYAVLLGVPVMAAFVIALSRRWSPWWYFASYPLSYLRWVALLSLVVTRRRLNAAERLESARRYTDYEFSRWASAGSGLWWDVASDLVSACGAIAIMMVA